MLSSRVRTETLSPILYYLKYRRSSTRALGSLLRDLYIYHALHYHYSRMYSVEEIHGYILLVSIHEHMYLLPFTIDFVVWGEEIAGRICVETGTP